MKIGLLIFDDTPGRNLAQKVGRAASRYRQKFGRPATVCYVHPSLMEEESKQMGAIRIAPLTSILQNHFWVGTDETETAHPDTCDCGDCPESRAASRQELMSEAIEEKTQ